MNSEHSIQNQIRVELSKAGYMVFRINVGKVRMADGRWFDTGAPKGFCDLFGFRPDGQIFFIEVKNEKGRVRDDQKKFMDAMRLHQIEPEKRVITISPKNFAKIDYYEEEVEDEN